jgi:hypothetical protein
MKKAWLVVLSSVLVSLGTIDSAKATEPAMKVFSVSDIQKVLVEQDNYKCTKWEWDKSSKTTEVFSRCSQANAEAYIHGNADPLGSQSDSVAFTTSKISFLSFTAKDAKFYPLFELEAKFCSSEASYYKKRDDKAGIAASKWFKENYKSVSNKKKLSKVFNGLTITIIGGVNQTRTVTCGVKPS